MSKIDDYSAMYRQNFNIDEDSDPWQSPDSSDVDIEPAKDQKFEKEENVSLFIL